MFKRLFPLDTATVAVKVEGKTVIVAVTDSVATAVYAAGYGHMHRSPVSGEPRAPYCMMGVCFECLVEIDGEPNHQACMTPVREGMRIKLQTGPRGLES